MLTCEGPCLDGGSCLCLQHEVNKPYLEKQKQKKVRHRAPHPPARPVP